MTLAVVSTIFIQYIIGHFRLEADLVLRVALAEHFPSVSVSVLRVRNNGAIAVIGARFEALGYLAILHFTAYDLGHFVFGLAAHGDVLSVHAAKITRRRIKRSVQAALRPRIGPDLFFDSSQLYLVDAVVLNGFDKQDSFDPVGHGRVFVAAEVQV